MVAVRRDCSRPGCWAGGACTTTPGCRPSSPSVIGLAVLAVSILAADAGQDAAGATRRAILLLMSGLAPLSVAAAGAPPGRVGSPHAVLGFAVLTVAAMLALRFTGRRLGTYTAIVTVGAVATVAAPGPDGRDDQRGDTVHVRGAGLRARPTTPRRHYPDGWPGSACRSSRRPPVAGFLRLAPTCPPPWCEPTVAAPVLEGPASVRDVLLQAERARSFLTGLLVGLGVLMVVSLTALSDPAHADSAGCRCCWSPSAPAS